jgi:hypothetical protein
MDISNYELAELTTNQLIVLSALLCFVASGLSILCYAVFCATRDLLITWRARRRIAKAYTDAYMLQSEQTASPEQSKLSDLRGRFRTPEATYY